MVSKRVFTWGLAAETTRRMIVIRWQIVPFRDRVRRGGAAGVSVLLADPGSPGSVSGRGSTTDGHSVRHFLKVLGSRRGAASARHLQLGWPAACFIFSRRSERRWARRRKTRLGEPSSLGHLCSSPRQVPLSIDHACEWGRISVDRAIPVPAALLEPTWREGDAPPVPAQSLRSARSRWRRR